MKIRIEVDETQVRRLVREYLEQHLGDLAPKTEDVRIEVKSKQNFRAEWETASFRAVYESKE